MNDLTFTDLFDELKLEIFKYLNLNERIICGCVSREWRTILSLLPVLQETLVIGLVQCDSSDRMKLSLCNINARHVATPFNTIDLNVLKSTDDDDKQKAVGQLLKSFKNLRSVFIYAPIKINLSDLPDSIEHIHFGHNTENVITFDKICFPKLTCISTVDAHLDDLYLDGITKLLQAQKLQLENVSVCEVPLSLCEQIIDMPNLKQVYVFDFNSTFDKLYKEKAMEVMDAHPKLQHFNMFVHIRDAESQVCPTGTINWLLELGSRNGPLDRDFLVNVFNVSVEETFEFAKEFTHGLHLSLALDIGPEPFQTKLNGLRDLRLAYYEYPLLTGVEKLLFSLDHHLGLCPNVRNLHLRFFSDKIFDGEQWLMSILSTVSTFAQKNSSRTIQLELSAFGEPTILDSACKTKNLNVVLKSLRPV